MDGMDGFFDVVAAEHVTNVPLAPAVLTKIIDDERCRDLARTVTTVVSGAAPLSAELRAEFPARTGLPVEQGYGLTEAAPGVSVTFGAADLDPSTATSVARCPASRSGSGTEPKRPSPARSGSAATICSPATGPTDTADRLTTAGSPPATSDTSPPVPSSWSTGPAS